MSEPAEIPEHHEDELESSYVPPPQKTIGELLAVDQEDESLRKYKEALLGNAIAEKIVIGEGLLCQVWLVSIGLAFNLCYPNGA